MSRNQTNLRSVLECSIMWCWLPWSSGNRGNSDNGIYRPTKGGRPIQRIVTHYNTRRKNNPLYSCSADRHSRSSHSCKIFVYIQGPPVLNVTYDLTNSNRVQMWKDHNVSTEPQLALVREVCLIYMMNCPIYTQQYIALSNELMLSWEVRNLIRECTNCLTEEGKQIMSTMTLRVAVVRPRIA